jgi:hypothetical protein
VTRLKGLKIVDQRPANPNELEARVGKNLAGDSNLTLSCYPTG